MVNAKMQFRDWKGPQGKTRVWATCPETKWLMLVDIDLDNGSVTHQGIEQSVGLDKIENHSDPFTMVAKNINPSKNQEQNSNENHSTSKEDRDYIEIGNGIISENENCQRENNVTNSVNQNSGTCQVNEMIVQNRIGNFDTEIGYGITQYPSNKATADDSDDEILDEWMNNDGCDYLEPEIYLNGELIDGDMDGFRDSTFLVDKKNENNRGYYRGISRVSYNSKSKYPTVNWNGDISFEVKYHEVLIEGITKEIFMPFMSGSPIINMSDIVDQGDYRCTWVLASITAGSSRPLSISKTVNCEVNQNRTNSFVFSFFHFDSWINILVDNKLPMHSSAKAAYSKCYRKVLSDTEKNYTDETDFWVPLLEKAMAKFCGSYAMLNNGTIANGLHYMTGSPTMEFELGSEFESVDQAISKSKFANFFTFIQELSKTCILTARYIQYDRNKQLNNDGLLANNAYTIFDTARIFDKNGKSIELLRILSPYADKANITKYNQWNGEWSHKSEKWNTISNHQANRLPHNGEIGDFWMSKDDWFSQFDTMTICLMPDFLQDHKFDEVSMRFCAKKPFVPDKNYLLKYPASKQLYFKNGCLGYRMVDIDFQSSSEIVYIQVTTNLKYADLSKWNLTCLFADHDHIRYNRPIFSQDSQNIQANNTYMFYIERGSHSFQINMSPKYPDSPESVDVKIKMWSMGIFDMNLGSI